jgi:phosphatidate cytidylyltransferase
MSRVVTALVLLPPLLAVILFAPGWVFLAVAEIAALLGARELFAMAGLGGYRLFRPVGYLATALLTASFYPGMPSGEWIAMLALVALGLAAGRRGAPRKETFPEVAITLLGAIYAGLMIGAVVGLRMTSPESVGRSWVLFLLAVIMLGDTGAYYVGKSLGRKRLAPSLSPNKTVEGLVGGVAAAVVGALVAARLFLPDLNLLEAALLGLVLSLLGVGGDLFESALKRSVGVKNSSSLMPGHGGILDRLDSLLFSAPALLAYVRLSASWTG